MLSGTRRTLAQSVPFMAAIVGFALFTAVAAARPSRHRHAARSHSDAKRSAAPKTKGAATHDAAPSHTRGKKAHAPDPKTAAHGASHKKEGHGGASKGGGTGSGGHGGSAGGPTGPTGPTGPKGRTGPTGPTTPTGPTSPAPPPTSTGPTGGGGGSETTGSAPEVGPGGSSECAVGAAPSGPPAPAGGWSVAFADAFCAPLGTAAGQDRGWSREENEDGFTNSNEIEVFRAKQAVIGPQGLELACTYRGGSGRKYECGAVDTSEGFHWKTDEGETMAFECYCRWPLNTGEADPGWWTDNREGNNEYDFFEGFGWGEPAHSEGEYDGVFPAIVQSHTEHSVYGLTRGLGFNPSGGFHHYTTVLTPDGGNLYTASEYLDGVFRWSLGYTTSKQALDDLKISYALREYTGGFTSGTRDFDIRSVAVYEDGAHAGQDIEHGGVAAGTTVAAG
jgi:hypothetical protein